MNQEASRQSAHYASVRARLWPKVKDQTEPSPRQVMDALRKEGERAKAARIEAYRRSLAEDAERSRAEKQRIAQDRREERERAKLAREQARVIPKWEVVGSGIDFSSSNDEIIAAVMAHFPGLIFEELLLRDNGHRVGAARIYVMYALWLKLSNQSEVGRLLGRDPSTVNTAIHKVQREIGA